MMAKKKINFKSSNLKKKLHIYTGMFYSATVNYITLYSLHTMLYIYTY